MGVISTMARATVDAGPATMVSKRLSLRHAGARELGGRPRGAAQSIVDEQLAAEVERLGRIRHRGLLTDDEFEAAKARLLDP